MSLRGASPSHRSLAGVAMKTSALNGFELDDEFNTEIAVVSEPSVELGVECTVVEFDVECSVVAELSPVDEESDAEISDDVELNSDDVDVDVEIESVESDKSASGLG